MLNIVVKVDGQICDYLQSNSIGHYFKQKDNAEIIVVYPNDIDIRVKTTHERK